MDIMLVCLVWDLFYDKLALGAAILNQIVTMLCGMSLQLDNMCQHIAERHVTTDKLNVKQIQGCAYIVLSKDLVTKESKTTMATCLHCTD